MVGESLEEAHLEGSSVEVVKVVGAMVEVVMGEDKTAVEASAAALWVEVVMVEEAMEEA